MNRVGLNSRLENYSFSVNQNVNWKLIRKFLIPEIK